MPTAISLKEFNSFQLKSYGKEIHFIKSESDLIPFFGRNPNDYYIHESPEDVTLRIGAGENWHEFVLWALAHNYFGIENLSLIPGSVGAAPVQNIGAYGAELSEVFVRLEGLHLKDGKKCP